MRKRFRKNSGDAYQDAQFTKRDEDQDAVERRASARKAKVWEVWHKADNKVYWVTEGVDVFLDSDEPHLKLSGFFPCPRRPEERRVGKECVSQCRSRWSPYHQNKKTQTEKLTSKHMKNNSTKHHQHTTQTHNTTHKYNPTPKAH